MQTPPSAIARQWHFASALTALAVNGAGDALAATCADGTAILLPATTEPGEAITVKLHEGTSLSLAADLDEKNFISGGDDGRVVMFGPDHHVALMLAQQKGRWIDHVAASPSGKKRAYSFGKFVQVVNDSGAPLEKALEHPNTIGGIAFSPNGKRLAASHYNGVSLWWTAAKEQLPVKLEWKGSHLETLWSPDGKILLTSMQENALHGWRLEDKAEMRMQGYMNKVHSWGWSPKGKFLVTAGAPQIICWPFFGGGPWGKAPEALGLDRNIAVSCVAPHPRDEMLAAGYADGMISMAPLDSRKDVMIHPPVSENGAAVIGLAWNAAGDCLFAALENGYVMLFTIDSVARAVRV